MTKIKEFEEAINELICSKVLPSDFELKSIRVNFTEETPYVEIAYGTYGRNNDKVIKWDFTGTAVKSREIDKTGYIYCLF